MIPKVGFSPEKSFRNEVQALEARIFLSAPLFPGAQYPTQIGPDGLVVGDFNEDRNADLALPNGGSDSVSVFLGDPDGTFKTQGAFDVGGNPAGIAVADLNGDGHLDLVTTHLADDFISILFGRGDGTFRPQAQVPVGAAQSGLVVSDINRDGRLDIIVYAKGLDAASVDVLVGRGDGTFQSARVFSAPLDASLSVADVDGDGRADLLLASTNDGIGALQGNGDGTFQPWQSLLDQPVYPQGQFAVIAADLDEAANLDFVIAAFNTNNLQVYLSDGHGGYSPGQSFTVGSGPYSVISTDVNGDGIPDLVATSGIDPAATYAILLGLGHGRFDQPISVAGGFEVSPPVFADFNHDGTLDLAFHDGIAAITVLLGSGTGTFQTQLPSYVQTGTQMGLDDIDGDGRVDLIGGADLAFNRGNGDGTFQQGRAMATNAYPQPICIADLNADGKLDMGTSNAAGDSFVAWLGNGDGTFRNSTTVFVGTACAAVFASDFNGDNKVDVLVSYQDSKYLTVLLGDGSGHFRAPRKVGLSVRPTAVTLGDINNDRKQDIVVSTNMTGTAHTLSVLLGRGDGTFGAQETVATLNSPNAVAADDFNNDGKIDLVTTENRDVAVVLGKGDGTFESPRIFPLDGWPRCVATSDLDGDGFSDVVVTEYTHNNIGLLLGNGDGTFQPVQTFEALGSPGALRIAEFNGDGQPDIISAGFLGVGVLLNTGNVSHRWAQLQEGSLVISGTAGNDAISVQLSGGMLTVKRGTLISQFEYAAIRRINILAGDGNDSVIIGPGVMGVYINGGNGNDRLIGGDVNDSISGGAGKDFIQGGAGNDWIDGGKHNDFISAGDGNDIIYGGFGNDSLSGDAGADRIQGGPDNDAILGGAGGDVLYGEDGNDILDGGDGSDRIYGGAGNDTLTGGANVNILRGDAGDDRFSAIDAVKDSIDGGLGMDSVSGDAFDVLISVEN